MRLLPISLITQDQQDAISRLFGWDFTFLVAKMGAGKTIVCLTALEELFSAGILNKVLIVAPNKVCETVWRQEAAKWEHTAHLKIAYAEGTPKQRNKVVESDAQIVLVSFGNIASLLKHFKGVHGFDGLVIDELSKLRDIGGVAFKALRRRIKDFKWRVGMTGTPVSEDFEGLYGQMMMVDGGAALGTSKDRFLTAHFFPTDYMRRSWALRPDGAELIAKAIMSTVYTMPDYRHELPELRCYEEIIDLPDHAREVYDALRRDMLLLFDDGSEVEAVNSAVLVGKLAQAANGFLYTSDDEIIEIHQEKLKALKELVEEIDGSVLIVYWYEADRQLIEEAFNCPTSINLDVIEAWNASRLPVLAVHPRSGGHGLNLPYGGAALVWYGPQWSRDLYEQTIARIWRRGRVEAVDVYTIIAAGTIDEEIVARIDGKGALDGLLMEHLAQYSDNS